MFKVITNNPIAIDSPDHIFPAGTMRDNSRNRAFNHKLYKMFEHKTLYIMDLGCSGGGFVKDCIDDGHIAIGLEGSNYSQLNQRAEWATIPNNLFTCDITWPFIVGYDIYYAYFDVITIWEVFEHIPKKRLHLLFENLRKHLCNEGIIIGSISTSHEADHHQTVENREWWMNVIDNEGFINRQDIVNYFGYDTVRGPIHGAAASFIVALQFK